MYFNKNKMKKYFQLVVVFILIGISSTSQENLKSDSTITTVFNETEIKDLTKILNFFEEHICATQHVALSNIAGCYQSFFERMQKADETGVVEIKIPFVEQQNLYKQINESTFNEVWNFGKSWKYSSTDTLNTISLKYESKYIKFLEELGNGDNTIRVYYISFKNEGSISPSMFFGLLLNYDNYIINDIRVRLVIAIHYLTLNDKYERNDKY
jgi:hypothetical protein